MYVHLAPDSTVKPLKRFSLMGEYIAYIIIFTEFIYLILEETTHKGYEATLDRVSKFPSDFLTISG